MLRDWGYFDLATRQQMNTAGIFLLSRLLVTTALFDTQEEARINLLHTLQEHGALDLPVSLGAREGGNDCVKYDFYMK